MAVVITQLATPSVEHRVELERVEDLAIQSFLLARRDTYTRSRSTREQDRSDSRKPDEPIRLVFPRKRSRNFLSLSPEERRDYVRADHFILAKSQLLENRCPKRPTLAEYVNSSLSCTTARVFSVFCNSNVSIFPLLSFLFFVHAATVSTRIKDNVPTFFRDIPGIETFAEKRVIVLSSVAVPSPRNATRRSMPIYCSLPLLKPQLYALELHETEISPLSFEVRRS